MARTLSVYVSDELVEQIFKARVERQFRGKWSPYFVSLMEKDLASASAIKSDNFDVLVDLARQFHPTVAERLKKQLFELAPPEANHPEQPRILARLLEALTDALESGVDPRRPLYVADGAKVTEWETQGQDRIHAIATAIAAKLQGGLPHTMLNEAAPIGYGPSGAKLPLTPAEVRTLAQAKPKPAEIENELQRARPKRR